MPTTHWHYTSPIGGGYVDEWVDSQNRTRRLVNNISGGGAFTTDYTDFGAPDNVQVPKKVKPCNVNLDPLKAAP